MSPARNDLRWYVLRKYPDPGARLSFENVIEEKFNENFRRDLAADIGATEEAPEFAHELSRSVLPLIAELSQQHHVPVCFVRVQRRPVGKRSPQQSPSLTKYAADFRPQFLFSIPHARTVGYHRA